MPIILQGNIWSFKNTELVPRSGGLELGTDQVYVNESDLMGPLHVESGLIPSDVVVFLGFLGLQEEPETAFDMSYLVTSVDLDGSGILVCDDLAMLDPATWINKRVHRMWSAAFAHGYSLEDFGQSELAEYIRTTKVV